MIDEAWIRDYWAPLAASVIVGGVVFYLLCRAWAGSRRGRLRRCAKDYRDTRRLFVTAERELERAARQVTKLEQRADAVAPRRLDEARNARSDAHRLCEIRTDQLKVAENHLRRIILEEYPPSRHSSMLRRYGVPEHTDARPFSFDGG